MTSEIINLEDFRVKGAKVFTGRDGGEYVRMKSGIDSIEETADKIEVVVPDDVYSINPSFLEEFLVNVVTKLGSEGLKNKFTFTCKGEYNINRDLDEAIDRILRDTHALI